MGGLCANRGLEKKDEMEKTSWDGGYLNLEGDSLTPQK